MELLKLNIQFFAHKKGQSSTSNGRDSIGRRLGAKAADGEFVTAGSILYRQRGTKIHPGVNTKRGNDDSIFTTVDGIVKFERVGKTKSKYLFTQLLSNTVAFFLLEKGDIIMFVDEVVLKVIAGSGGDGCTAFRREKYIAYGGPYGGNGGHGADIIFKVDEGLHTLLDLRYQKLIKGEKGENGKGKNQHGKSREPVVVKVPQGTVVTDMDTGLVLADLKGKDSSFVVAHGGRGGRGNTAFKTQNNTAPNFSENGEPGEEREIKVELKLLADVGLVGFPSVGKSTIISSVSKAKPK